MSDENSSSLKEHLETYNEQLSQLEAFLEGKIFVNFSGFCFCLI
jgi:hypothetical protein